MYYSIGVFIGVNTNMAPIQLYSSKKRCQDIYGNIFAENYLFINDISLVQTNTNYSFLKKIKAPPQCYFIYCVCDCKNNVIKLGKSSSPFKRVVDHVNNFICYVNI